MSFENLDPQLKSIIDNCETEGEVREAVASLSFEDKMKHVYKIAVDEFAEAVQTSSINFLDWIEANEVVNDKEQQRSKREVVLGMLRTLSVAMLQSSNDQFRAELQTQSEHTQYGMRIEEASNELARALQETVEQMIVQEAHYEAVLLGRRMSVHFTGDEGTCEPYSDEEIQSRLDRQAEAGEQ